jgi:ADP-heptose:LPS heptosyltransferase
MARILVIKHGAFGDLVQALGGFQDIRLAYPQAHITLLTSPAFKTLMQRCESIDAVLVDSRPAYWKWLKLIKCYQRLKQQSFDLVIDLQNTSRTALYRKWVFPKVRWIGRLPHEPQPVSGLKGLIALLQDNGMTTHNLQQPKIEWLAEDVSALLARNQIETPYVLLIPGASAAHPEKRWPYYPQLAQRLIDLNISVVSVLGPDERELAKELPRHVLTKLSWFELAGVIQNAQFVVGNDTGPCHIASCFGKRGFALFGPTTSASRSELARANFKTVVSHDLTALSVDRVFQMLLDHIEKDCSDSCRID